jgi:hypothetical protein
VPNRQDSGVRPGRHDIAAPDLPENVRWVGDPQSSMAKLTSSGPALVHFFDFAQLNSVRALPYVLEWHRRYAALGLSVIGVQAPRFPFGADPEIVARGLRRLGISHPVAIDAEHEIWLDYGCSGWPSLFLWGRGGILRWYHFGEGDYAASEEAIQEELRESDALRELPEPMKPLRATDAPGAAVIPPTEELFPAGEGNALAIEPGREGIRVGYAAGGAYATVEGAGRVRVGVDGTAHELEVDGAGLYELAAHPRHEAHRLEIEAAGGDLQIWSVSFAPGVP